tara:strand:- start:725 stop:1192 length:468 start_codon:yes stop_codon:yes gene_type:complete
MGSHRVGQILFIIGNNNVVPIQVVEEVVRTTLDGVQKTYMVQFPDKSKTIADIAGIKGGIFKEHEEVRSHMVENANKAINKMIDDCLALSNNVFNTKIKINKKTEKTEKKAKSIEKVADAPKMQLDANEDNMLTIDLGNGQIGKISQDNIAALGG